MKIFKINLFVIILAATIIPISRSWAAEFFNNQLSYQGYLKNGASPLNDLTGFPMMFVIRKDNVAIWCQTTASGADIPVVNGIFTTVLSGASNCLSLTRNFDQTLFVAAANTDIFTIDTTVDVAKNGFSTPDDATFAGVLLVPVPMALVANQANNATNFTGSLTGDVTGTQTATVVSKIQGITVAAGSPSPGQVLEYASGSWVPTALPTPAVSSVAGRTGAVVLSNTDITGLGTASGLSASAVLQTANSLSEISGSAVSARGNLGAAASGSNGDITALTGLTTALSITEGGTGATTASAARTALAVAGSGTNSDITSISGLTTPLSVTQGGTAASSLAANSVVITNGTGTAMTTLSCSSGQVLSFTAMGVVQCSSPTFGTITSLGLSLPNIFTVTGSPVTSSGTITATLAVANSNSVFAGPAVSPAGTPAFRALVAADLPNIPASQISSGQIGIANGGTGATSASTARTALGAAASGANGDITSLAGLTSALPLNEGGTGTTTASAARTALGAAASGANGDITSLAGLTTALVVSEGGTGATTASAARTALSAAASGANSDITSMTGLTTALPLSEGGTGATTASSARTALTAAASGANGDITSMTAVTSIVSTAGLTAAAASGGASIFGSNGGAASTTLRSGTGTLTVTSASTAATAVTISATGTGGGITMNPGTGGLNIGSSGTQKIKVGTSGTAFSAAGTCSFASAMSATDASATCTGVPASTSVVIHCSPSAAPSAAAGFYFRNNGTVNTVNFASTVPVSSQTWNCFWWQP